MKRHLTAKLIERLLARGEPTKIRDSEVRGLLLVIKSKTAASWLLRFQRNHREGYMGLGSCFDVPLKDARERARDARLKLSDGVDPLAAKRADKAKAALEAAKVLTFKQAATQFFDQHEARWQNAKYRSSFLNTLRDYAFPVIGGIAAGDVDTALVIRVLDPIWKTKTVTADRVRNRIELVLGWATVRGYRTGDNPARWRGHLQTHFPPRGKIAKTQHHAALPYSEVPGFLAKLRTHSVVSAKALEFTILTAARTGEVTGAQWDEFDLDGKVWTVPAARMKAGKEHRVPLSAPVIELLKALPTETDNDNVFIATNGGISSMTMHALLRRLDANATMTVHGFRSSFRDWAAERTAVPQVVAEMALAHTVGNAVEAAYRRSDLFDKRRKLMDAWATYCTTPVASGAKVVPMRKAK
jgi:integrase